MEKEKRDLLSKRRAALNHAEPVIARALGVIEQAGLSLSHLTAIGAQRPGRRCSWLATWKVGDDLRQRFELAPEVMMLVTPWSQAQAQDIDATERALRAELRCDRGLVLALTADHEFDQRLHGALAETHRVWVVLGLDAVAGAVRPDRWLRQTLTERLGVRDLFGVSTPVAGWDFFGRERELADLRRTLLLGRPVCLYGVGKVGKTSLLRRLRADWIEEATAPGRHAKVMPIHVDLQGVGLDERDRYGVMRQVLASTVTTLDETRTALSAAGLRAEHRAWEALADLPRRDVLRLAGDALRALVRHVAAEGGAVVVVLDEYERLYGADRGIAPDEGLAVLDVLRGMTQQSSGRFCFALAGRSREHAQRARVDGEVNPLYNFVVPSPVAGLTREGLGQLVTRIGVRAGVTFSPDAVDVVYDESGGHPFLARQFCRVVERPVDIAQRAPFVAERDVVKRRLGEFRREVRWTMDEVLHAVRRLDEDAPAFLSALARGERPAGPDGEAWHPEVVDELVGIGILRRAGDDDIGVRIGAFRAWLQANWQPMGITRAAG